MNVQLAFKPTWNKELIIIIIILILKTSNPWSIMIELYQGRSQEFWRAKRVHNYYKHTAYYFEQYDF